MRRLWFPLLLLVLLECTATAGQIYGSLRENGRGVGGVRIEIARQGQAPIPAATGPDGGYNVAVPGSGRCVLRVYYKNAVAMAEVSSYADPVKYDFDLVFQNGGYTLQRK